MNYYLVIFGIVTDRQTDRQTYGHTDRRTDGHRHIRAHSALAQVGSKSIAGFCKFWTIVDEMNVEMK